MSEEDFRLLTYLYERLKLRVGNLEESYRNPPDLTELKADVRAIKSIMWGVLCSVIAVLVGVVVTLAMVIINGKG